jgi:adenylylsulfate kinase
VAFATRAPLRPTQQGVTVWFTGLPSAGKTTIADLVGDRLAERGHPVELLDGDVVRASVERVGGFVEVHVATELATCQARDVKGLYARHARGELRGLTGVDDPYEPPLAPELVLDTAGEPPEASAARVLELLERRPAPALLGRGQLPPPEFSRPEVAQLLADGYRTRRG